MKIEKLWQCKLWFKLLSMLSHSSLSSGALHYCVYCYHGINLINSWLNLKEILMNMTLKKTTFATIIALTLATVVQANSTAPIVALPENLQWHEVTNMPPGAKVAYWLLHAI